MFKKLFLSYDFEQKICTFFLELYIIDSNYIFLNKNGAAALFIRSLYGWKSISWFDR